MPQTMQKPSRIFALVAGAAASLAVLAAPAPARADGESAPAAKEAVKDPAKDPQVARLLEAKKTMRWNQVMGSDRYGHAEALVDAPADTVAKHVMDFGKYKELHKKFSTARVVGKEGDQTDVYMRYPVVIGSVTIELHEVMRFGVDRKESTTGVHTIEAIGVKGDMKRGHTKITIKPVDAKHSVLQVDILLVPTLPAPQSFIDEELRDGAADYVASVRDKGQGWSGPVVSL